MIVALPHFPCVVCFVNKINYEEDYEYSVNDIIDKLPQVKNDLEKIKEKGYVIKEISTI